MTVPPDAKLEHSVHARTSITDGKVEEVDRLDDRNRERNEEKKEGGDECGEDREQSGQHGGIGVEGVLGPALGLYSPPGLSDVLSRRE